ncbi:cora-like Mg2+ transporter protein-domain-containing protein [Scenedesmus sp. NREL 46B-D3]|nr:cora-like Mg2+ transporter protein-domain-containing protein [Scenedesmus sp. NREL 46B-D3]
MAAAAAAWHHLAPAAAPMSEVAAAGLCLEQLPRYSSQHFWLHEQSTGTEQYAGGPLQGLAHAVGAVMHGMLGSDAVAGPQAASQIAYPIDEGAVDSGSEGGSQTRQSLLRHNLSRFSDSSSGSGSGSLLLSGAGGVGASTVGRPSLFAPGLTRGASSSQPGGDVQRSRSNSCSAAGRMQQPQQQQQQQQQQQEEAGEGPVTEDPRPKSPQRSKKRWQSAAANVMQMNKVTSTFQPGGLQGLDVKRHNYDSWMGPLLHTTVNVTVTDFDKDQVRVMADISNAELKDVLRQPRPEWSRVRWVNVQRVASCSGLELGRHPDAGGGVQPAPLSVEDIVHIPQRIKTDFYENYLYTSVLLLSVDHPSNLDNDVMQTEVAAAAAAKAVQAVREGEAAAAPPGTAAAAGGAAAKAAAAALQHRCSLQRTGSFAAAAVEAAAKQPRLQRLRTRLQRPGASPAREVKAASLHPMELLVEQASIFLFRDGTLLTMFSHEGEGLATAILDKLKGFKTLLTDSEDASFLLNAVLDAVVDHTMPVVQVYASRIASLETQVLLDKKPPARLTKELHLLCNDLKGEQQQQQQRQQRASSNRAGVEVLRRTLVPTQHLINKLQTTHANTDSTKHFLSPLTLVYMSDVLDHISTIVEDMETLAEDARDLIDLVFNTIAHHNNTSMQMLAVVSTIFLPITFLAGVFGMNFDQFFPEIHWQYGYIYFWGLCSAITVVFAAMMKRWGMFSA